METALVSTKAKTAPRLAHAGTLIATASALKISKDVWMELAQKQPSVLKLVPFVPNPVVDGPLVFREA